MMTGQKRYARSQTHTAAELKAWRMMFSSGYDFLHALPRIGIQINGRHQPDLETARAAWTRLGDAFLASHIAGTREPWALRTFGSPSADDQGAAVHGRRL